MTNNTLPSWEGSRKVLAALARNFQGSNRIRLVVAVSGGTDSLALLHVLNSLPSDRCPDLVVAHFSHGFRPNAERRELAMVQKLASSLGLHFVHGSPDQRLELGRRGGSVEASAREARYSFLARVANDARADAVAVAHTVDDQAETVLLRMIRGSGPHGIAAMREVSVLKFQGHSITVFRPFLHVTRANTEAICTELALTPSHDSSNRLLKFSRNRVRHKIIPEALLVNSEARDALARFALSAQVDDDFLRLMAAKAVSDHENRAIDGVRWPRSIIMGLEMPLFVRVIQSAWQYLWQDGSALSRKHIMAIRRVCEVESRGRVIELPHGLRFEVEQQHCTLRGPLGTSHPTHSETALSIPGTTRVGQWTIGVRNLIHPDTSGADAWSAAVDGDSVIGGLTARSRRPGDRFQPFGSVHTVSIKDLMINVKLPRTERDDFPLIASPDGIVWVPGVSVADWAKVTDRTINPLLIYASRLRV